MASNSQTCIGLENTSVNFSGNTPSSGQTWITFSSAKNLNRCITITSTDNIPGESEILLSATTDCLECFDNDLVYGVLTYRNCLDGGDIAVLVKDFINLPTQNSVYYLDVVNSNGDNVRICATATKKITFLDYNTFIKDYNGGKIYVRLTEPTMYTDCQDCLSSNTTTWVVTNCATNSVDYISVPPGITLSETDLITYTIGADQYCGTKAKTGTTTTPTGVFVSNLGTNVPEINDCITCLSGVAEKRIISRCGDPETQEVVWNSLLNEIGTSTNLSNSEGCWEIGDLTTSAVTLTGFLNFDPQPDCQQCTQCNGIYYEVVICSGEDTYIIRTNEFVSGGTRLYIPNDSGVGVSVGCVVVLSQTVDTLLYDYQINSFSAFTGCPECETYSENVEWWSAKNCNPLIDDYDTLTVVTASGFSVGDIVKVNLGNTYLGCYELVDKLAGNNNPSIVYYSDTETPYIDCETCRNEVQIGLSIASCSNNEHSFVNVNLSDYETIIGGFPSDFPQQCIRIDNSCFYVVNDCILTPSNSYNTPTISQFSFSCGFCTDGNLPRSANTETIICEQVCISGGSGGYTVIQVVPPHPVWTDGYGTPVTQMNAVTLGGMFGLNS
jgi:hypothetical protein